MSMNGPALWNPLASQVTPTVASRSDLSALVLPIGVSGGVVFCAEAGVNDFYALYMTSGAAIDGTNVLATTRGGASRWIKLNLPAPITTAIEVQDEGVVVPGGPFDTLNFTGAGVTASNGGGGVANVAVPGFSLGVENGGVPLAGPFDTLNFTGLAVASDSGGGVAAVNVPAMVATRLLNNVQSAGGASPAAWVTNYTPTLAGRKALIWATATGYSGSATLATMEIRVGGVSVQAVSFFEDNPQRHLRFDFLAAVTLAAGPNAIDFNMTGVSNTTDNGDYATLYVIEYPS